MTNLDFAKSCGLTEKEWNHLVAVMGRVPSLTELQMIGVMWSEHCSYKSSKHYLKQLMTKGDAVLEGPGENAGLVKLDETRAIAFKVESHNHPSFVEPFQGAATGVGGILRDIFTMGARPIATGNYLRFGELSNEKHKHLLEGVVSGIAHYGNCMGIPTLGGHISSNACYNGNILVNVFALGVVDQNKIFKSSTAKPNQSVMIWGAKTGRDGIHGASLLASADFGDNAASTEQKIRVQVGDPFKEKVLMEATLEAMHQHSADLEAIQDMGAAGLTCSTMEISQKSQIGMKIDLAAVPTREEGMLPFELLLSESQERMLAIVKKGSEEKFKKVLHRWGCEAAVIGETTDTGRLEMFFKNEKVVDLNVTEVMDPPAPDLPEAAPSPEIDFEVLSAPEDIKKEWDVLERLISIPSVASKKSVYERYDTTVGVGTVFGPGHEAAVVWVGQESEVHPHLGLAFKGVATEELSAVDGRYGAKLSLAQAVRGLACVGAKAMAYTDGINIGNPYTPKVQYGLDQLVKGLNDAANIFKTPCVSGNVSMYNQTTLDGKTSDIFPTIFVVAVGKIEDVRKAVPSVFQKVGSEVWLLEVPGQDQDLPVGSLYARTYFPRSKFTSQMPFLDLQGELRLQSALLFSSENSLMLSCRDIGRGGLAVSIAKACFGKSLKGFEGDWTKTQLRRDQLLFGESQGRVLVEIDSSKRAALMKLATDYHLQLKRIGNVIAEPVFRGRPTLNGSIESLFQKFSSVIS